uniref:Uncharacterized protein n=1 Tax=Arundo donax TaxID=35708 RepID=A0A0A9A076_ARUDO
MIPPYFFVLFHKPIAYKMLRFDACLFPRTISKFFARAQYLISFL